MASDQYRTTGGGEVVRAPQLFDSFLQICNALVLGVDRALLLFFDLDVIDRLQALKPFLFDLDQADKAIFLGDYSLAELVRVVTGGFPESLNVEPNVLEHHTSGMRLIVASLIRNLGDALGAIRQ